MQKRVLGIDLGTKRIGLAITDPLNIISQTYKTILFKSKENLVDDLIKIINEKNIGTLVFGLPLTLRNKESDKTREIKKIVDFIKTKLPSDINIVFEDEALTSVEAHETLRKLGKKPGKNKDLIDQLAAQQILMAYQQRNHLF